ncbi:MAG TPA: NAD(P)-dependent oxidoreductase [Nocardioidaceae bacterium]|nr:NAD(P)-dependent oxidoreductase [Nocardioidaceae bacterium]
MTERTGMTVLVTGAFGNVGRATVRLLLERGYDVVATDVRSKKSEAGAAALASPRLTVHWVDLRDPAAVDALVQEVTPTTVIHLAAIIPPIAYAHPGLAKAVNVEATGHLVEAVSRLASPCRFVFASSIAVYGSRNPHRDEDLSADSPLRPRDVYGAHKVAAEALVTASPLEWVVLRLGAVMFPTMSFTADTDSAYLEGLLPQDARIETVDVRDVATAFVNAVDAPVAGKTLLIGGGEGNRLHLHEVGRSLVGALGLPGVLAAGRDGDPADDDAWFVTDWMDTAEAQELLQFQQHTFADTMNDLASSVGWKRRLLVLFVPLVKLVLWWRHPLRGSRVTFAPLWSEVEKKWGAEALSDQPRVPAAGARNVPPTSA